MDAPSDDVLKFIANGINLSRDAFADLYDPLATKFGTHQLMMIRVVSAADDSSFYPALLAAREGGWLEPLCLQLLSAGALPAIDALDKAAQRMRVELQAIVRPSLGYLSPALLQSGVITATRRVCRIYIDYDQKLVTGTGFLVGPQALLTAGHVIAILVDSNGKELDDSHKAISVEFDQYSGLHRRSMVKVAAQWLIGYSPKHPLEDEDPSKQPFVYDGAPETGFDDHLDFALIRLADPIGRERGFYRLNSNQKPQVGGIGAQVTLFQHPENQDMLVAMGHAMALWPNRFQTRLQHDANAQPGSSGGLLVDNKFQPVALHQLGVKNSAGKAIFNGAIPTFCIAANHDFGKALEITGLDPLWEIATTGEPVVGREKFQRAVHNCITGARRILLVSGEAKSGKSFSTKLLRAMLGNAEHCVVVFSAAEMENEPQRLALQILKRIALSATVTELPSVRDAQTTVEAWIRDTLFPEFASRLRSSANQRIIWLVIDDLDHNPLPQGPIRYFLQRLYQEIESLPFLRMMLIGLNGMLEGAPPKLVERDNCDIVTEEDIVTYINRYSASLNIMRTPDEVQTLARIAEQVLPLIGGSRLAALSAYLVNVLQPAMRGK